MKCKKCGNKMVVRDGKRGKFYGCTSFPTCRNTVDFLTLSKQNQADRTGIPAHMGTSRAKAEPEGGFYRGEEPPWE